MTTSVDGLASGIKYNDIITAMMNADRASTAVMEKRKAVFQTRLDSLRSLNTKMLSANLDLATLNRTSLYNARTVSSSNSSALSASATSTAKAGTYSFDVVQTAKAHQLAAAGKPSSSTSLGAGTLNIQLGSGATTAVSITAGSSSLDDIAQAINGAGIGVSAAVINDGSATPYRLMLTAKDTGTANAITVSGTASLATLFTGATNIQDARDAIVKLGSGTNAITFQQASNTFSNIVPGLTLTSQSDNVSGIQVTVGNSASGAKDALKSFITSFNDVAQFMVDNASYNPTTKLAGPLFTDAPAKSGFTDLLRSVIQAVPNQPLALNNLTSLGVSIDQKTNKLTLDEAVFDAKIAADPIGVGRVFTNSGTSTDPGVSFSSINEKTKTTSPFTVNITQAATKAIATGTFPVAANSQVTAANKNFAVTVNGTKYSMTLTEGTYLTANDLVAHLQSVLNQKITATSDKLTVGLNNGDITLTSANFGAGSTITVDTTTTGNSLFGLPSGTVYGRDVQGTINGAAATGSGQILSGIVGSASEGLRLSVTATQPISATVTTSKGIAQSASEKVKTMTDNLTGSLVTEQTSVQSTLDAMTKSIASTDERLAQRRSRYEKQFQTMEQLISKANNQGAYFTSQAKAWSNSSNNN